MVGTAVVAAFRWRWRAAVALGVAAAVIAAVALGTPHIRHSLLRESGSGLNQASSGRAKLVTQGIRIALHHPVAGRRASAGSSARTPTASGCRGRSRRRRRRTTPP